MDYYKFTPETSYFIEVGEGGRYLFLYFTYINGEQMNWRLSSKIKRIKELSTTVEVETGNSVYELNKVKFNYRVLTFDEFMLCREGLTPEEAKNRTIIK
ncbi:MAG: hypothetical protein OCD00_11220 [Colwellia sp.]